MQKNIKTLVKSNKYLFVAAKAVYGYALKSYFSIANAVYAIINSFKHKDSRLTKIEKLKGIYNGKRCFIVATGPSLRISDLELLRDEVSISMNSIIKLFDKTLYRPTVYMTQDDTFFMGSKEAIRNIKNSIVCIGINDMGKRIRNLKEAIQIEELDDLPDVTLYDLNLSYNFANWRYLGCEWGNEFSFDCSNQIYDGGTVTYSAIQLAVYMGCNDIYLVGVDNGTKKGQKQHYTDDEETGKKLAKEMNDGRFEKYQKAYVYAYKTLKSHGYNLYNATRGGALEGVPRVDLDSILRKK